MNADPHTVYEVDYSITGVNPEEVEFKATQSEHVVIEKGKRSLQITLESSDDQPASFCWRRTDKKSKKLDFYIKRNLPHSADVADRNTLDSMEQDILLLQEELETLSRNIQRQKELEEEHFKLASSSSSTQTWMSILKMLIVIGICVGQVYMITTHFQGSQNKRHQIDPFAT